MLNSDLLVKIEELDTNSLPLDGNYFGVIGILEQELEKGIVPSDEMLSRIIGVPSNDNSMMVEGEFRSRAINDPSEHPDHKEKRLGIVKLLKKEFHDFLCTQSEYYKKERLQLGGNINVVIVGLASAMAAKLVSLEAGLITSFVTVFFKILAKVGKRAICQSFADVKAS